eukprot:gene13426-14766_t
MYKFTTRSCSYEATVRDVNGVITTTSERLALNDIKYLISYYEMANLIVPDHTSTLQGAEVITRSDTFKAVVHIYYQYRGTRMYNIRPKSLRDIVVEYEASAPIDPQCIVDRLPMEAFCEPSPLAFDVKLSLVVEDPREHAKISAIHSDVTILCF